MASGKIYKSSRRYLGLGTWESVVVIVLLITTILAPYAITQWHWGPSFMETGQIGDTIGGITAPFINLLAAFLVYVSFREQIKANKQLSKENSLNYVTNLFDLIKTDFYENEGRKYKSSGAISNLKHALYHIESFKDTGRYNQIVMGFFDSNSGHNEITRKSIINTEIRDCLRKARTCIFNLYNLVVEIEKSKLELGLQQFYNIQIEKMLADLDIWMLFNDYMLGKFENDDVLDLMNRAAFRDIKVYSKQIKLKGYFIQSKLID